MLKNYNIICFSNDWNQDPLSKHHIMGHLAKQNRILWINSIGMRAPTMSANDLKKVLNKGKNIFKGLSRIEKEFYVYTPFIMPFHNNRIINYLNNKILLVQIKFLQRLLNLNNPILWSFLPNTADIIGSLNEILSIYYCTDDFTKFEGYAVKMLEQKEKEMVKKVDLCFFTAQLLLDEKGKGNKKSYLMRHGVDLEHFKKSWNYENVQPDDIKNHRRPIIGFWGELNESIDYELVKDIASNKPEWNILLIGGANNAGSHRLGKIRDIKNIVLIGPKPYSILPQYAAFIDVAILPKNMSELSLKMNPLKLREYLAAGLPVVATPLPEVLPYGDVVKIAETTEGFIEAIESSMQIDRLSMAQKYCERVSNEGWGVKVEEISAIIEKSLIK